MSSAQRLVKHSAGIPLLLPSALLLLLLPSCLSFSIQLAQTPASSQRSGAHSFSPQRLRNAAAASPISLGGSRSAARGGLLQLDMGATQTKRMEFLQRKKLQGSIERLAPLFDEVRSQEFFRYYAVDLLSSCTFFPTADSPCDMDRCEIESTEDVPEPMRERDEKEHDFRLDGWVRWDMPGDFTEYYDLIDEPERYTEYDGSRVWKFIHNKICFQQIHDGEDNGEWKQDFNRAISGLHTSVSSHIVETMPLSDEEMAQEYKRRIADIPDALDNLVYAYYLSICAIYSARTRLESCDYMGQKDQVQPLVRQIINDEFLQEPCVEASAAAMREHVQSPFAMVWKARLRTRDLLGIMNCVQCNVCRLHGKVAALGLAVALQLILGQAGEGGDVTSLHRIEVAALMTTAGKFAKAIAFCTRMERLLAKSAKSA